LLVTVPFADLTINVTLLPVGAFCGTVMLICITPGNPAACPANTTCAGTPPTVTVGIAFALHSPLAAGQVPLPSATAGVIDPSPVT
jgi:hypothetical protein